MRQNSERGKVVTNPINNYNQTITIMCHAIMGTDAITMVIEEPETEGLASRNLGE